MTSIKKINVPCSVVTGKMSHLIINYELDKNDGIYKDALNKAPGLAQQLNSKGPDGIERPIQLRETMAFSGAIAESVVLDYLNQALVQINPEGDIYAAPVHGVSRNKGSFNQIDILVSSRSSGKSATIEVRSSNIYMKDTEKMYNVEQSLVGWYVNSFKPDEVKKDFYITLYFRHSSKDLQMIMKQGLPLTVQIAAGASKAFLLQKGSNGSLRMGGTQYRIVNPIILCSDIDDLAMQIYHFVK